MSFSMLRRSRPGLGTTLVVGAVTAALALSAPPRAAGVCSAGDAPRARPTVAHVRSASDGEVSRGSGCTDAQLPPLAIAAAVLAMLAVPRARQGCVMEL